MKAYVINLKKRPDRLKRFMDNIGNFLGDIELEIVEGVDGSEIDPYNDFYSKNVNPWNFKHLNDKGLRGVIGCCESHLLIMQKIIDENIENALIFEDDAFPAVESTFLAEILTSMQFPKNYSVIYLNSFRKPKKESKNFELVQKPNTETAESYIISNEFAHKIHGYCNKNIGAFDAHLEQCIIKNKHLPHCHTRDPIFYQYARSDSNIR